MDVTVKRLEAHRSSTASSQWKGRVMQWCISYVFSCNTHDIQRCLLHGYTCVHPVQEDTIHRVCSPLF